MKLKSKFIVKVYDHKIIVIKVDSFWKAESAFYVEEDGWEGDDEENRDSFNELPEWRFNDQVHKSRTLSIAPNSVFDQTRMA